MSIITNDEELATTAKPSSQEDVESDNNRQQIWLVSAIIDAFCIEDNHNPAVTTIYFSMWPAELSQRGPTSVY